MNERETRNLSTPDDYAKAVSMLLDNASKSVDIFSPDLSPVVFRRAGLIAAVRGFVLRSRFGMIRMLVRDTGPLTRENEQLLTLVQRISSKISLRALADDFHGRGDAFAIADGSRYILRRQAMDWAGVHDVSRPEIARKLQTEFNEMWEHSLPDPGVRRLNI